MKVHANAALGPGGRIALVRAIELGMTQKAAAAAFCVSPATAHRWWHRWLDASEETRRIGVLAAIPESGRLFWDTTVATVKGLGGFVTGLADRISAPEPAPAGSGSGGGGVRDGGPIGIVGITRLAGQAVANNQWAIFIAILIQLNIVVGVFNLLPLPPMDGGYLAFVLWQVVTRREVDLRKVVPVAALIVGLLVMLTVGLVWLDITNPVPYPFR